MPDTIIYRIILADDHNLVRRGLAALLEMEQNYTVVCEAKNGEEALRCLERTKADIIILDLSMPRLNGLETVRRIHRTYPALKILILSMYDDPEFVTQTLHDGAAGYILKQSMEDELFEALAAVHTGHRYTSSSINLDQFDRDTVQLSTQLTPREHEVLQLIAEGHTTTEIADFMYISPHTANRHRANIMQKMGVRNQVELIRLAVERGLIILNQRPNSIPPAK